MLQVPDPQVQDADLFIIEMPQVVRVINEENGKQEIKGKAPVYMTDPWTQKNLTAILPTPSFRKLIEFVETRDSVRTGI